MDVQDIQTVATKLAETANADILFYNGVIERPYDEAIIDLCNGNKRRENVYLFLCTLGGDADAAYRIARCLQQKYKQFTIFICGMCKSAGTLIAIGAHEIVMSDYGELGPLDVQLGKKDELWETDSGLTVLSAIKQLEEKSFDLFETCFLNLKGRSGDRITLKTATDLAVKLAIGTISPVMAQIDPMHVGEASRAMNIGLEYATRLSSASKNPNNRTIQKLGNLYPSHGFVIDRNEAQTMFNQVREPDQSELELIGLLGQAIREQGTEHLITFLSNSLEAAHEDNHETVSGDQPSSDGTGSGEGAGSGEAETQQDDGSQIRHLSGRTAN